MSVPTVALTRRRYRVVEGSCLDCAGDVAGGIGRVPGVRSVEVLAAAGIVFVEHDGQVTDEQVARTAWAAAERAAFNRSASVASASWWRSVPLAGQGDLPARPPRGRVRWR